MRKITVMSAGNGGQALAGDLALRGHSVTLYEHPAFAAVVDAIRDRGNIITMENRIVGDGKLANATTDAAEALHEAEIVYFTAPSFAQKAFFDLTLPYFRDGQILILSPGNYGTFGLKNAFRKLGRDVLVGETDNLPYACAAIEPEESTSGASKIPSHSPSFQTMITTASMRQCARRSARRTQRARTSSRRAWPTRT